MSRLSNENVRVGLSNQDFLELPEIGLEHFLLPHEASAIWQADEDLRAEENRCDVGADDKDHVELSKQGLGPCFFDSGIVSGKTLKISQISRIMGSIVVDYPEPLESRVTIGSRVLVAEGKDEFAVDIVGFRELYPDTNQDVEIMDIYSPLAVAIIGKTATSNYVEFGRSFSVRIVSIDQTAFRHQILAEPFSVKLQR